MGLVSFGGFLFLIIIHPIMATLAEGFSPHTMDAFFLEGVCWFSLWMAIDIL